MGSYCNNRDQEVAKAWEWDYHITHLQNIISHIYIIVAIYMCPQTLNPKPFYVYVNLHIQMFLP